jgi:hypothetical protein
LALIPMPGHPNWLWGKSVATFAGSRGSSDMACDDPTGKKTLRSHFDPFCSRDCVCVRCTCPAVRSAKTNPTSRGHVGSAGSSENRSHFDPWVFRACGKKSVATLTPSMCELARKNRSHFDGSSYEECEYHTPLKSRSHFDPIDVRACEKNRSHFGHFVSSVKACDSAKKHYQPFRLNGFETMPCSLALPWPCPASSSP